MSVRGARADKLALALAFAVVSLLVQRAEAAPAVPTIAVSATTLTPSMSGGCYTIAPAPCYKVYGHTDPDVKVTVVVTDTFGGTLSVSVYSYERTDPGIKVQAGDYVMSPNVTGLGRHDTTPSTLSFVAYAEDASGNKSATSPSVAVTKIAAAPDDADSPTLTASPGYPTMVCGTGWCNFSLCLLFSVEGALPGQNPSGGCTGRYKMGGSAEDANATSDGVASEIADVVLTVTDSSGAVVTTVHAVGLRRGTLAYWQADILATDYVEGQTYSWSIVAIDAAGNVSAPKMGTFARFPL